MPDQFARTEIIFGSKAMEKLYKSRVAVFGIGGVGGYAVEALARSGVGTLDLIDGDKICLSNINRQIFATHKTLSQFKADAAEARIKEINPKAVVNKHILFFGTENADLLDFKDFDYIIDAIDAVEGKIEIAVRADKAGVPVISAMGAGNKTDPTAFQVSDIFDTTVCPLARIMRRELKKRGIKSLKVVYSAERPVRASEISSETLEECGAVRETGLPLRRLVTGSNAFVPSVMGLILAGEAIKDLVGFYAQNKA